MNISFASRYGSSNIKICQINVQRPNYNGTQNTEIKLYFNLKCYYVWLYFLIMVFQL